MTSRNILLCIGLLLFSAGFATPCFAALSAEQRREITSLSAALSRVNNLFERDQFKRSAEGFSELQERVDKIAEEADAEIIQALADVHKKMLLAHALLELEGVELPPIKELKPAKPMPGEAGASFVKDVAPMLVAKCGRCHINQSRGEFSMRDFPTLMRGVAAGVVIFPNDPAGSRIVEVIESGDMPRGGSLTDAQFTSLKNWIAAGAKFDGEDPQANLNTFAAADSDAETPTPTVAQATGNETVSFSRDIAPVLVENCSGCHVDPPRRARGQLNMTSFDRLLTGGDSGPPIAPGQPANSLIVDRIKGEGGGQQMPQGREPLSDEVIAKIEKWIEEGATYDAPNRTMRVAQVAALTKARDATHEELSADRMKLAAENWNLGMAGSKSDQFETKNFFLVGNVGTATLEEYGERAEALAPKVAQIFGAPSTEPLLKGRMTLFLFGQRYDYSEFGQMVEKRELPNKWRGHWNFTIIDAYGAMIPPRDTSYSLDGLVAQQLAGAYIASLNNPPRWFSEGSARVAASRLAARDPRVASWKDGLPAALAKMQKPDDFLTGKLPAEDADIAAFSFVSGLMKNAKGYNALLNELRDGKEFPQAFTAVYGAGPPKAAEVWARTVGRRR
jgi:hypothetical protein